jgi:hypothetical protein
MGIKIEPIGSQNPQSPGFLILKKKAERISNKMKNMKKIYSCNRESIKLK